jgi:hypothetical protein
MLPSSVIYVLQCLNNILNFREYSVKFVLVVVVSSDAEHLFQFIFGGPTRALCQLPEMEII